MIDARIVGLDIGALTPRGDVDCGAFYPEAPSWRARNSAHSSCTQGLT